MFGRIRSAPSSSLSISPSSPTVEWLEQERPPSKLLKDDSLSIYEATLMKLKQGSRRSSSSELNSSPVSQDSMEFDSSVSVSIDLPANSGVSGEQSMVTGICSSGSDGSCASVSSSPDQEQKRGNGVSIQLLFSRYTSSLQRQGTSSCSNGSPTSVSGCSSDSGSTGCSKFLV